MLKLAFIALASIALPAVSHAFQLSSDSVDDGKFITSMACEDHDGDHVSPQISISGLPSNASHVAVILDDPDAVPMDGKIWVHWVVVNIPAENGTLSAGETVPGTVLPNSDEDEEYGGLCPEDGTHTYRLSVFALDAEIDVSDVEDAPAFTLEAFQTQFSDIIVDSAVLEAAFP